MCGVYNIIEDETERGDNLPEIIHKVLKEKEGSYYTIGFTVPKNVVKITVSYDYHRGTKGFMSDLHPTNTIPRRAEISSVVSLVPSSNSQAYEHFRSRRYDATVLPVYRLKYSTVTGGESPAKR